MKLKYSIIIGLTSLLSGFIPLSFLKNNKEITYTIYTNNILQANQIKEELIVFYKQYCYSFSFSSINEKIIENIDYFKYKCTYKNNHLDIYYQESKIKMTGYLFSNNPSSIEFKYYFSSLLTSSIPLATSISVATFSLSDQIW